MELLHTMNCGGGFPGGGPGGLGNNPLLKPGGGPGGTEFGGGPG